MSVQAHVEQLRRRHAECDDRLAELNRAPSARDEEIATVKRSKLRLKDEIERLSH